MKDQIFRHPDLHMHSTFSDGSDTPQVLISNVRKAGLDIFALTDHDTYDGCAAVRALLDPGDPFFINGVELSCDNPMGKFHILGYGFDPDHAKVREAVGLTHRSRMMKTDNRFAYLEGLGFVFTEDEKREMYARENPGKPHFAQLLLKKGYVGSKEEGFEVLGKYHGSEPKLSPEQAVSAILSSGGIPVLAHGILADGSANLGEKEIEARVRFLKDAGLMGLECYYSTFTEEQKRIMLALSEKYGLLVTAGSDYHGTNKTVRLGQTNDPDPERMRPFYKEIEKRLS